MKNQEAEQTTTDLIVIKQLPIIEERLKGLSTEIDNDIKNALALPVTDETVKEVKKVRARLNKTFTELDGQRKMVKEEILKPYYQFEDIYKTYISNKLKEADKELAQKIIDIESQRKREIQSEVEAYYNEYATSQNIDFAPFLRAGINITLSASIKSLKEQVKTFIDSIVSDISLIETQEHKDEILVEYRRSLNCSQSITSVIERKKALEEQRMRLEEQERRKTETLQNAKKVEAVAAEYKPLEVPTVEEGKTEELFTVKFTVTGSRETLKALKEFLNEGGYVYE